jgi:hypothetical protein
MPQPALSWQYRRRAGSVRRSRSLRR